MEKIFSALFLVIGVILAFRGFSVWIECGYDCSVMPYVALTATTAMALGAVIIILGASLGLGSRE